MASSNTFRDLFSKRSAAERLATLRETVSDFDERAEKARTDLATLIAETGEPESANAKRLLGLIADLTSGKRSVTDAITKLEAEVTAEDEAARAKAQAEAEKKAAKASRGLEKAARDFDRALAEVDSAHRAFDRAVAKAQTDGAHFRRGDMASRMAAAVLHGCPGLYRLLENRMKRGAPQTNSHRNPLGESYKAA